MDAIKRENSVNSLCRICLEIFRAETGFDLFLVPGLAKKLCMCASLSIDPQDGFPKNICGTCYTRLNDLHEFQKLCVDSVQRFQEMLAKEDVRISVYTNDSAVIEEASVQILIENDRSYDPLLNHELELIGNEDDVVKMLQNVEKEKDIHKESKEKNNAQTFTEKKCFKCELSNDIEMRPHENEGAKFVSDEKKIGSDNDDDKPLIQRMQKMPSKTKGSFNDSNDDDYGDDKKDNNSNESKPKTKTKRYVGGERNLQRMIDCNICHQKFKKAERYQEHMKYHNKELPHQCTVESCRKGFTTANALRQHVEYGHAETLKWLSCPVEGCGCTFYRAQLLNCHLKTVHKTSRNVRNTYINTTSQEKKFNCELCSYSYHNEQNLLMHVKIVHDNIKDYVCQYCGKTFGKLNTCKMHEMTHATEKQ